jgi:hypothetical protein
MAAPLYLGLSREERGASSEHGTSVLPGVPSLPCPRGRARLREMRRERRLHRWLGGLAVGLAIVAARSTASAGEIQFDGGVMATASTWREDYGGGTQLRLGYRFARVVAVDAVIWEQLMGIDVRLATGLTLGLTATLPFEKVRPTLRAFAIHQHEEPLIALAEAPVGALFGIGQGIRHRAGGGFAPGVEIPFVKRGEVEGVVRPAATIVLLSEDEIGPQAYFMVGLTVGLNYSLEKLP